MKEIATYYEECTHLRDKLLASINGFFIENPDTVIDVEKVEGSGFALFNEDVVETIDINGVQGSEDYAFADLSIEDLEYITGIINNYVAEQNKTLDKCRDNNL